MSRGIALAVLPGWPRIESSASKRLTLVRHAEGLHNKHAREIPNYFADGLGHTDAYWDAPLTAEGEEQAGLLAVKGQWRQGASRPQLVVVSPMTRALQTASLAWPDHSGRRPPIPFRPPMIATSLARERIGNHTCDGRRSRSALAKEFPHVNFGEVAEEEDEMWHHKEDPPNGTHFPEYSQLCLARGTRLLEWLWARPEADVAVVSHWVFLRHLLHPFPHRTLQAKFENAEQRFVTLLPAEADEAVRAYPPPPEEPGTPPASPRDEL